MDALFATADSLPVWVMACMLFQCMISLAVLASLRANAHDRAKNTKEVFGLVRKLEGITAENRTQLLRHYDSLLQGLIARLPATVASEAGDMIFDTESKILKRLAELEPALHSSDEARKKLDEIVTAMEGLESTLVSLTSKAVREAMEEGRREIARPDRFLNRISEENERLI
jgi:hypothetical protein